MKRILLVDDSSVDVMLTRMALDSYSPPLKVITARNGKEAYRLLNEIEFDLLFLDIMMPLIDGFELLENLRAERHKIAPAIIVSGSSLHADRARAAELGAVEYIQKAVDYGTFKEDLFAAIKRVDAV